MTFPIIYKNLIQTLLIQTLCVFSGRSFFFFLRWGKFASPNRKVKIILKPAVTLVNKLLSKHLFTYKQQIVLFRRHLQIRKHLTQFM